MASFDLCEHVLQNCVFPKVDLSKIAFVSLARRPDIFIQAVKKISAVSMSFSYTEVLVRTLSDVILSSI